MVLLMNSKISGERFIVNSQNLSFYDIMTLIAKNLNKKPPEIKITPFLSYMGFLFLRDLNKKYGFSREPVNAMFSKCEYSNKKIINTLKYEFIPLEESIKFITDKFVRERNGID